MKKTLKKGIALLSILFLSFASWSQSETAVYVDSFHKVKDNQVEVSIKTEESFYIGANRYVLHIGGKHFMRSLHPEGRLDEIIFFMSLDEYNQLINDKPIVLVYGYYYENVEQDGEGAIANGYTGKHWKLGKFVQEKLTDQK